MVAIFHSLAHISQKQPHPPHPCLTYQESTVATKGSVAGQDEWANQEGTEQGALGDEHDAFACLVVDSGGCEQFWWFGMQYVSRSAKISGLALNNNVAPRHANARTRSSLLSKTQWHLVAASLASQTPTCMQTTPPDCVGPSN
jgi:hypothetical protein